MEPQQDTLYYSWDRPQQWLPDQAPGQAEHHLQPAHICDDLDDTILNTINILDESWKSL